MIALILLALIALGAAAEAAIHTLGRAGYQYTPRFSVKFALYDPWIGAFHDRAKKVWYVCPLPCVLLKFDFGTPEAEEKAAREKRIALGANWRGGE